MHVIFKSSWKEMEVCREWTNLMFVLFYSRKEKNECDRGISLLNMYGNIITEKSAKNYGEQN